MVKRTLCFTQPAYLNTKNDQLVVNYPNGSEDSKSVPIEDIGYVILENAQITVSNRLLEKLISNNTAVINCNQKHMPIGMFMPLNGNTLQNERFREQINASLPLKKNLWQQTIKAKITNQANLLETRGISVDNMKRWSRQVTSGDSENYEARAAAYYWRNIFELDEFKRHRFGEPPNHLLNYGYAILRAVCARAIVSSGLLPTLGIHHANKYNAYCLADDIMEPYRPYVDSLVCYIVDNHDDLEELTPAIKKEFLQIPAMDVILNGKRRPLMIAMSTTTYSLYECFCGISRKLQYPEYE